MHSPTRGRGGLSQGGRAAAVRECPWGSTETRSPRGLVAMHVALERGEDDSPSRQKQLHPPRSRRGGVASGLQGWRPALSLGGPAGAGGPASGRGRHCHAAVRRGGGGGGEGCVAAWLLPRPCPLGRRRGGTLARRALEATEPAGAASGTQGSPSFATGPVLPQDHARAPPAPAQGRLSHLHGPSPPRASPIDPLPAGGGGVVTAESALIGEAPRASQSLGISPQLLCVTSGSVRAPAFDLPPPPFWLPRSPLPPGPHEQPPRRSPAHP